MMEPRDIHRNDQLVTAMREFATALAKMYHELVAQGVPRRDATALVAAFAEGWGRQLAARRRDGEA